jgi:asparagine synthase (glutamine-hydrolysing)
MRLLNSMCGIAGIISSGTGSERNVIESMTNSIAHRGPDGDGHWVSSDGRAALGHRRLAIIDLSDGGRQPMFYAEGRYTITFNGEIYNYLELREALEKEGVRFESASDTEVLLALFHKKKEKCLADLDGMFAFAIWDDVEKKLFCARDRFGEKPFYFAFHNDSFYFASEMKALWKAGVPRNVDERMLFNFLRDGYVYNPHDLSETFFRGITKLKAAHFFYISPEDKAVRQERYWDLDPEAIDDSITQEQACARFRELFDTSVERRLRADVPVGSSLSGGLDSTLIVCTIDKLRSGSGKRQATFSARFPGFAKDEGRYMELVIGRTNVEPHFVTPDDEGLAEELETLFHHQEEPFGSASIYAQYCVMRLAKQNNVTVLMDGQGADELLAGYHGYFQDFHRELKIHGNGEWKAERAAYREKHRSNSGGLKSQMTNALPDALQRSARMLRHKLHNNFFPVIDRSFF